MKPFAIVMALILTGCSMSVGVGFRKTPMVTEPEPVLTALSPEHIKTIIDLIGFDKWTELAPYALRENEEATVGAWCDIEIR